MADTIRLYKSKNETGVPFWYADIDNSNPDAITFELPEGFKVTKIKRHDLIYIKHPDGHLDLFFGFPAGICGRPGFQVGKWYYDMQTAY